MTHKQSRQARCGVAADGPDLVQLSLVMLTSAPGADVIEAAMRVLEDSAGHAAWAIFSRLGPGRYQATLGAGIGHADVRAVTEQVLGPDAWLSVGRPMPLTGTLGLAQWCALPEDRGTREPELILACWARDGRGASWIHPLQLLMAGRLIAAGARSLRVFQYLVDQTTRDPLTGLLNRRGILDTLKREAARAGRSGSSVSVLFLDLDEFKAVNDRHGHAAGDGVLMGVAGLLAKTLRTSDAVGRLGGDEFLAVLPDTGLRAAYRIARRLSQTVRTTPIEVASGSIRVDITIGAASFEERLDSTRLIEKADQRMLERKRRQRRRGSLPARKPVPGPTPLAG